MVITEHVLSQVGPAISCGNSMLVYGKPGDGKTYLIESLNNLDGGAVFVPYAIECQGNIVRVFDPVYHQPIEEREELSVMAVAQESSFDRRWSKCRRPFIVSGGELTLDMLDLRLRQDPEPAKRVDFLVITQHLMGNRVTANSMEAIATPDEVARNLVVSVRVLERDLR